MAKKYIIFVLAAAMLGSAAIGHAADRVGIATNTPYRPMEYQKPNGELGGFDIELGNALCKQAGLKCNWIDRSYNGMVAGLMARKYDAIMAAMTITKQRSKHVLFSHPYIIVPSAFYVPVDSSIHTIDEASLKGKKIGVQRGTTQDRYVTAEYGDVASIKRYANVDGAATDLATGRINAIFLDSYAGVSTLIDKHPGKYRRVGKFITKPKKYLGEGVGLMFRKSDKSLAAKFNNALAELMKNGAYRKLFNKYFGEGTNQNASMPDAAKTN